MKQKIFGEARRGIAARSPDEWNGDRQRGSTEQREKRQRHAGDRGERQADGERSDHHRSCWCAVEPSTQLFGRRSCVCQFSAGYVNNLFLITKIMTLRFFYYYYESYISKIVVHSIVA